MKKTLYNCIIIGGGPAGARAALELSKFTNNILLIDYREILGDKLCTGIIGKECAEKYGLAEYLIHNKGNSADIINPSDNKFHLKSNNPKAFIIDRAKYVQEIIQKAIKNNIQVFYQSRVTNITVNKKYAEVSYSRSGIKKTICTKSIILASGLESKLISKLNIKPISKENILNGSQIILKKTENITNTKVFLGSRFGSQGFGWVVPTFKDELLIGVLTKSRSKNILHQFLSSITDEYNLKNTDKKLIKSWGIPIKPLTKTYSDRVLIIGDSAGIVKPVTGGGIYYSQISADIAVETLKIALDKNNFSEKLLSTYEAKWMDAIGTEIANGNKLRNILFGFEDNLLDNLTNFALSNKFITNILTSNKSSFDNHFKSVLNFINNQKIMALFSKSKYSKIKEIIPNMKKDIF